MQELPFDSIDNCGFKKDISTEEQKDWLVDKPSVLSSQQDYRLTIRHSRDVKKARIASLQFF